MGKSSPLTQSAAAPFTPESESLRKHKTAEIAGASGGGWSLPGQAAHSKESASVENQLGEGAHQNYSGPQKPPPSPHEPSNTFVPGSSPQGVVPPQSGGKVKTKLNLGWDKLLVTQKNICKKALNLLSNMEAPASYFNVIRAKSMNKKHQGIILDCRSDEHDHDEVVKKKKDEAA